MASNRQIVERDYTTKELYEVTRAKRSPSAFYSKPFASARIRLQQLDAQIERKTSAKHKKPRIWKLLSRVPASIGSTH